jgi:hypothetical protein
MTPKKHQLDYRPEGGKLITGFEYSVLGTGSLTKWDNGSKVLKFFKDNNHVRFAIHLHKGRYYCQVEVFELHSNWKCEREVASHEKLHEAMKLLRQLIMGNEKIRSRIKINH